VHAKAAASYTKKKEERDAELVPRKKTLSRIKKSLKKLCSGTQSL
jgi:hypothetical protein